MLSLYSKVSLKQISRESTPSKAIFKKMFNMENLDLEGVNRQFLLESQGFLGQIGSGGAGSCTSSSSAHSDLFFYDDSSNSEISTYSYGSDDENSQESAGEISQLIIRCD